MITHRAYSKIQMKLKAAINDKKFKYIKAGDHYHESYRIDGLIFKISTL